MGFTFWSNPYSEPKRQYKYLVRMAGLEPFLVSKVSRPAIKIGETSHKYLNHTFFYPGVLEWEPVSMTLVDPGDGKSPTSDVTKFLFQKLIDHGYRIPDSPQPGGITELSDDTISKGLAVAAMGNIRIETLRASSGKIEDGQFEDVTEVAEAWELVNPWILDLKWGEFDYSGEDLLQLDLTIRYDFARLH